MQKRKRSRYSFDLFGLDKYMYTFKMKCEEEPDLSLGDDAVRIFLNTKGTNPEAVSQELVELLKYMENTSEETSRACSSERIRQLQERVKGIKSSEEVGVKYMQEWEERELDRREAREEGREEGMRAFIETLQELGVSRDSTKAKAAEKFNAEPDTIEGYMEKYWK